MLSNPDTLSAAQVRTEAYQLGHEVACTTALDLRWSGLLSNPALPLLYLEDPTLCPYVRDMLRRYNLTARAAARAVRESYDATPAQVAYEIAEEIAHLYWTEVMGDGERRDCAQEYARRGGVLFEVQGEDLAWAASRWVDRYSASPAAQRRLRGRCDQPLAETLDAKYEISRRVRALIDAYAADLADDLESEGK